MEEGQTEKGVVCVSNCHHLDGPGILNVILKLLTLTVHLRPKNSISVKCQNKSKCSSDYHLMRLISPIKQGHNGFIRCSEFSSNESNFATGDKDGMV